MNREEFRRDVEMGRALGAEARRIRDSMGASSVSIIVTLEVDDVPGGESANLDDYTVQLGAGCGSSLLRMGAMDVELADLRRLWTEHNGEGEE